MKTIGKLTAVLVVTGLAGGCASAGWDGAAALDCESIEMQVKADGTPVEVEYHILPSNVPKVVQDAMVDLYPGGEFVAAEHETHGGQKYWELTIVAGDLEVEAMFLPDGTLHSMEVEVPEDEVPHTVKSAAKGAFARGNVTAWEEIRNARREIVEYHVKIEADGRHYKIAVLHDGKITARHREVVAEIEVPLD